MLAVDEHVQLPHLRAQGRYRQVEVETLVRHVALVGRVSRKTRRRQDRYVRDVVVRGVRIVVELQVHAVLQECQFEADVPLEGCLPFEVGVGQRHQLGARDSVVHREVLVHVQNLAQHEVRVTRRSDVGFQGDVVEDVLVHELLVGEVPAHAHGPERRYALFAREVRRAVDAVAGVDHVAVVERVVDRAECAYRAHDAACTAGASRERILCAVGGERLRVVEESRHLVAVALGRILLDLAAEHSLDGVASERFEVGEVHHAVVVGRRTAGFFVGSAAVKLFDGVVDGRLVFSRCCAERGHILLAHPFLPVVGERSPEAQVVDDLPVCPQLVRQAQVVAAREVVQVICLVEGIYLRSQHRGADTRPGEVAEHRDIAGRKAREIVAVAVLDTEQRKQLGVGRETAVGRILRVGESHLQVARQLELAGVVDQLCAAAVGVARRADHHAVREVAVEVDLVTQRAVAAFLSDLRTAFEEERMGMFEGRAQGLCEPVGVHAVFGLLLEEHQQVAPFGVLAADGPV